MKQFLSFLLALTLVLGCSASIFADTPDNMKSFTQPEGTASFDVSLPVSVQESGAFADAEYSITIEWNIINPKSLTLNHARIYKWNTETLKYELDEAAQEFSTDQTVDVQIKLTNRSNAFVGYAIEYADNPEDEITTVHNPKKATILTKGGIQPVDRWLDIASVAESGSAHDFVINEEKAAQQSNPPQLMSAEFRDIITISEISAGAVIQDEDVLKLGSFTVTLSEYSSLK